MKPPNNFINLALMSLLFFGFMSILGCRHGVKPDSHRPGLPFSIETDEKYMKCDDFNKAEKKSLSEKVVVLYSSGGSGHKSAADAVERALHSSEEKLLGKGRKYAIAKVDVLHGLLANTELFDKYMQSEDWPKLKQLVALQGLAESMITLRQRIWDNKVHNRIMHACDDRPPALIVSVFPIANYVYAHIARKNKIPFVILPTDYEISHFVNQIDESFSKSPTVFLGLPLLEPEVTAPLYPKDQKIPVIPYCLTGYPLRNEFTKLRKKIDAAKNEPTEIKKYRLNTLNIPANAKSILITLGGKGGALALISQYLEKLHFMQEQVPIDEPLHILVASGGDQTLIDGLTKKSATFSNNALFKTKILGRLDAANMALTMASVDAILLKPGGSTVAEAITLGTPMIIKSDSTNALPWEKTNMALVKRLGWGVDLAFTYNNQVDTDDLIYKVKQALTAQKKRDQTFFVDFQTQFPRLIKAINNHNIDQLNTPNPKYKHLCSQ